MDFRCLMMAEVEMLYPAIAMFVAISFLWLWRWETKKLRRKRDECRNKAYSKLAGYHSHSDHPKYEFSGKNARVVFRKEEFSLMEGHLAGTFIYLCRNAFDEYFLCVIDRGFQPSTFPKSVPCTFSRISLKSMLRKSIISSALCR
jgi:hypothetical protein